MTYWLEPQTKANNSGKTYTQACKCGRFVVTSVAPIQPGAVTCCVAERENR